MKRIAVKCLNGVRRLSAPKEPAADHGSLLPVDCSGQRACDTIREKLLAVEPCMIARLGHTELKVVLRYWHRRNSSLMLNGWRYVRGRQGPFWWDNQTKEQLRVLSGFFPCTDEALDGFADRYLHDMGQIDVLGSWLRDEINLAGCFSRARIVPLQDLEPYYHNDPWTTALEGRTVLVIHPFESSIKRQYAKRALLFSNPKILPSFTLKTLKAVQSLGGDGLAYKSWFDALDWMCEQVQRIEFDVALIGAGAYGLPLAAFVKGLHKKAVHLGGATQILFGIRGRRWDERPFFQELYNKHWTRPAPEETPAMHESVESGCYW